MPADAQSLIQITADIAALPRARFEPRIINLESEYHVDITNTLDFLFLDSGGNI